MGAKQMNREMGESLFSVNGMLTNLKNEIYPFYAKRFPALELKQLQGGTGAFGLDLH